MKYSDILTPVVLFILLSAAISACDAASSQDSELCSEKTGGALITFKNVAETFTGWFSDSTFVAQSKAHRISGAAVTPVFEEVKAGRGCDQQWDFHVAEDEVHYADMTIELCDGLPSYVDEHLAEWMQQVGTWCPWGVTVLNVKEQ